MTDCIIHKIRLETKRGDYKTQEFKTVKPYCVLCERLKWWIRKKKKNISKD